MQSNDWYFRQIPTPRFRQASICYQRTRRRQLVPTVCAISPFDKFANEEIAQTVGTSCLRLQRTPFICAISPSENLVAKTFDKFVRWGGCTNKGGALITHPCRRLPLRRLFESWTSNRGLNVGWNSGVGNWSPLFVQSPTGLGNSSPRWMTLKETIQQKFKPPCVVLTIVALSL